jgi:hypothetical protein
MNWLFQCNPKLYDLDAAFMRGRDESWAMNQHRDLVAPGDRVYVWETGPSASLRAIARVTSTVYERPESQFGTRAVDLVYENRIIPPLTRQILAKHPVLSQFRPFFWAMGTNIPIKEPAVITALEDELSGHKVAFGDESPSVSDRVKLDLQTELDASLKRARQEVLREVQRQVSEMDPIAFEWLVRALLLKVGYTDVQVTPQSNDYGVDVIAKLDAGGVAQVETAIQAKRTAVVGRPVVQKLRGSLTPHQAGLVITSGRFANNAIEEAQASGRQRIALVDGARLAQLLIEHDIGTRKRNVTIYTLAAEDYSLTSLQGIAEVSEPA